MPVALVTVLLTAGVAEVVSKLTPTDLQLYAVRVATSQRAKRELFITDRSLPARIEIAFAFWVVRDADRVILIDTGFDDPNVAKGWGLRSYRHPVDGLAQLRLKPEQVTDVIITHRHWDHINGLILFERAAIWITQTELRAARAAGRPAGLLAHFKRAADAGRLHAVREPTLVTPSVAVLPTGLHTNGFQYVVLARPNGRWVIASDIAPLRASLERLSPTGQTSDPQATRTLLESMLKTTGGVIPHIVPGHEPSVFRDADVVELK